MSFAAYIHALPPPKKVILRGESVQYPLRISPRAIGNDSQVRVDSRDVGFLDSLRERIQPALGLPLLRIGTPQLWVAVRREDANEDNRTFGDRDLTDERAVEPTYWLREGHHDVFSNFAQQVRDGRMAADDGCQG